MTLHALLAGLASLSMRKNAAAPRPARSTDDAKESPALPILIVESDEESSVPLSHALRNARFTNPIIRLPNHDAVEFYLTGNGLYRNRRKFPLPALILQDVTLPRLENPSALPWLDELHPNRQVVITAPSGEVAARHFESAVDFGPNAILCQLPSPDSVAAMFQVLRRICIED